MLSAKSLETNATADIKTTKVEQHFAHSAKTYQQGAQLQHLVANSLLRKISTEVVDVAVDLGCGPGLFTASLQQKSKSLVSIDLSSEMLKQSAATNHKVQANSHALPILNNSVDLIFSSLMIQWCDFEQVLQQIHAALKPGGKAYISTLINGSLGELQQAWAEVDDDEHIHKYLSIEQLIASSNKGAWHSVEIEQTTQTLWFDQVKSLAKELKLLGANYVQGRKSKGLMTKTKWQKMEQAYCDKFYCPDKQAIPASYQVVLLELKK